MVSALPDVFSAEFTADLRAAAPQPPAGAAVAVPLEGIFASPTLWADRRVLELADGILGDDYIIASLLIRAAGTTLPRATSPYDDPSLPPSALSLLVPLDGTPPSLVDPREALPPFSAATLELLYSRPWYVDPARLDGGPCLRLPRAFLPTVAPALARLFARAARNPV
jgi:hypothetical protein